MRRALATVLITFWTGCAACLCHAAAAPFEQELARIQQQWAIANYATPDPAAREDALAKLGEQAHAFCAAHPDRADALIWEGIVLSTYAGAKGGLGALGLAKKSRAVLEQALRLDARALDGSAYTSLGALYAKVPGFPIGFGSKDKAREFLLKALEINPDGIDPNYFYAEFLCDNGQCQQARPYLEKALRAPARPGRELADSGRRREINALLAKAQD